MEIFGKYQEGFSSKQEDAKLTINEDSYILHLQGSVSSKGDISELDVSDRLGRTLRKVHKGEEWVFSCNDDRVDVIVRHPTYTQSRMHKMESSWRWVVSGIVVIGLFSYMFVAHGIPYVSEKIAYSLPLETNQVIAKDALKVMDRYMLSKSSLSKKRQEEIVKHFDREIKPFIKEEHLDIKIHFRDWKMWGSSVANAFALPSGDVVLTDKFVNMTKNSDELDAVLLHEIGHVVHRDTLKSTIESTFIATVVAMAMGDASGFGDAVSGIGSAMIQSKYSRENESKADIYAFDKMLLIGINPHSFSTILDRITHDSPLKKRRKHTKNKKNRKTDDENDGIMGYFSSHPYTKDRIKIADAYSQCFEEKQTVCEVGIEEIANEKR